MKQRLDIALVEKGLARSCTQAVELIRAGNVLVDGVLGEKPSLIVDGETILEVTATPQYVGRGGLKLAHTLEVFKINVAGLTVADIGASTGGFTDCVLQRGAKKVYAIDVGRDQLVPELRNDARVISMESTDVREVVLPELVDLAVVDVSFISITKIFPSIQAILKNSGVAVVLIKPQFEVGKGKLGKHGVVKDESLHQSAVAHVVSVALTFGLVCKNIIESPILGGTGNKEFLAYIVKQA